MLKWRVVGSMLLWAYVFWLIDFFVRNVLAAATPYFNAMFTSGLMESEYEERQIRR